MKKRIFISLIYLLSVGLFGFVTLQFLLPTPTAHGFGNILFYLVEFILVISGPVATALVISMYGNIIILLPILFVGFIAGVCMVLLIKRTDVSIHYLSIPAIFWVAVGTFSSLLGIGAGV